MFKYLDHIKDNRVNCYSVMFRVTISDYLSFIAGVYMKKGGIEGQRSPLKTKSAQRIRKRLIEDLNRGTVIPPIVLGVKLDDSTFESLSEDIEQKLSAIFSTLNTGGQVPVINVEEQVSIIDGMQRTTALIEASKSNDFKGDRFIRLELWIAKLTNSLIYRMLVLNSGQIPWNLKRQLEVVFSQLKKELEHKITGLELFTSEEENSRSKAGQYQASQFIELFILFGTKRISIDIQEELAEEFARLDIIETSGNKYFMEIFYGVSKLLVQLDLSFSKVITNNDGIELTKFKTGKHIFSSQPARAGFFVAAAQDIFGLPGIEFSEDEQKRNFDILMSKTEAYISKIESLNPEQLYDIIDLPTLDEQINIRASKVGEFERNFFLKSFKTFIELSKNGSLDKLTPCWRSSH